MPNKCKTCGGLGWVYEYYAGEDPLEEPTKIECPKCGSNVPDKITPALILDKARELRAAGWWTPPGLDQIKAACFSAADMLEQLAAEAKRPDPLGEALNSRDGSYKP